MTDEHEDTEDAGITLPTVGGAVAKAANTGPGKALLNPAAKAFGDYLGWRAKEITEGWREKRKKNLEAHADKVQEKDGPAVPREPTERQFALVNEWIERAQEVDPEDEQVAALWQSLLGAIYRKENSAEEWLEILRQLSERDAAFLVAAPDHYRPNSPRGRERADKFVRLGLYEPFRWSAAFRRLVPFGVLTIITTAAALLVNVLPERLTFSDVVLLMKPILVLAAISSLMVLGGLVFRLMRDMDEFTLTKLGTDMQQSAWRYLKKPPEKEPAADPPPPKRRSHTRAKRDDKPAKPAADNPP